MEFTLHKSVCRTRVENRGEGIDHAATGELPTRRDNHHSSPAQSFGAESAAGEHCPPVLGSFDDSSVCAGSVPKVVSIAEEPLAKLYGVTVPKTHYCRIKEITDVLVSFTTTREYKKDAQKRCAKLALDAVVGAVLGPRDRGPSGEPAS